MVDMQLYPCKTAMEILLNCTLGRMAWGTAGCPHVSLFFSLPRSTVQLCCLPLPLYVSLLLAALRRVFFLCFLPARCLAQPFLSLFQILPLFASSFLLCAAFPHFLSLSANSRCLIHQHLLKLWAVLCTSVVRCMCETVCVWGWACRKVAKKKKKVCEIMRMHVTVSSSHLWHAASPHASVRKRHRWQNLRCHGGGNRSSETNSSYRETHRLRACESLGQAFPHKCGGTVWEGCDMKEGKT